MAKSKLRVIQDYPKLSKDIQEQIKLVYPDGYSEYLIEYTNPKGELVTALPFETHDKIYMVRMSRSIAESLVLDDDDFNDNGVLKSSVKEEYEDKHSDVDYLSENENYGE